MRLARKAMCLRVQARDKRTGRPSGQHLKEEAAVEATDVLLWQAQRVRALALRATDAVRLVGTVRVHKRPCDPAAVVLVVPVPAPAFSLSYGSDDQTIGQLGDSSGSQNTFPVQAERQRPAAASFCGGVPSAHSCHGTCRVDAAPLPIMCHVDRRCIARYCSSHILSLIHISEPTRPY